MTGRPLTLEQAHRRAGGRRRYNFQREMAARARRERVCALLAKYGSKIRGVQARIARELGVSEATISRDVRASGHMPDSTRIRMRLAFYAAFCSSSCGQTSERIQTRAEAACARLRGLVRLIFVALLTEQLCCF
jgi:hypothetical protein